MAENRQPSQEAALAAFAAFVVAKADIDAMLTRLAAHSADHFGISPDEVNWGHVGGLDHVRALLREVSDCTFSEGEYA